MLLIWWHFDSDGCSSSKKPSKGLTSQSSFQISIKKFKNFGSNLLFNEIFAAWISHWVTTDQCCIMHFCLLLKYRTCK